MTTRAGRGGRGDATRRTPRGAFPRACAVAVLLAASAAQVAAQGALSTLGFGYPSGGLSSRSLATGGALGELDPQSPLNPASIVLSSRAQAYFQYDPEFRSVNAGAGTVSTTTERFPVFMITGTQGRATFALSYASFMDRTWSNSYADTQSVGGERIASTVFTSSEGGIADARAAMAWTVNERLHFGVGVHLYPGQDRVSIGRAFADTQHIGSFSLSNTYTFSGTGVSFGGVWISPNHLVLAADLRAGGSLSMLQGDSTEVGSGRVPLRFGVSASYDGITGAVLSARFARDRWSDLRGLGSPTLGLQDANEVSAGAEVAGPRLGGGVVTFRAGFQTRGLPFTYEGSAVGETSFAGGLGIPVAGNRGFIDVGLSRASRSAQTVSEHAWVLSIGAGIRP